jgi:rhomboid family GlyGly-CTERM serine protease
MIDASSLALTRDALAAGEVWRLLTTHMVHFSVSHAVTNGFVFLVTCAILVRTIGARFTMAFIVVTAPVISLALLGLSPNLIEYRGLSGIGTATSTLALLLLRAEMRTLRVPLSIALALLIAKTVLDASGVASIGSASYTLPETVVVEWRAHAIGIACGFVAFAILRTWAHITRALRLQLQLRLQMQWLAPHQAQS